MIKHCHHKLFKASHNHRDFSSIYLLVQKLNPVSIVLIAQPYEKTIQDQSQLQRLFSTHSKDFRTHRWEAYISDSFRAGGHSLHEKCTAGFQSLVSNEL
jgi:hypothetical protein